MLRLDSTSRDNDRRTRARLWSVTVLLLLSCVAPASADGELSYRQGFYGTWASNAHCRWSEVFMLVYDRTSASLPARSSGEPSLLCSIMSVSGRRPQWKLRLSCQTWDRPELTNRRIEVRQTLTQSHLRYEMVVETEPFLTYPARREETRYCRAAGAPPPPLICFDPEKGGTYPCEP